MGLESPTNGHPHLFFNVLQIRTKPLISLLDSSLDLTLLAVHPLIPRIRQLFGLFGSLYTLNEGMIMQLAKAISSVPAQL